MRAACNDGTQLRKDESDVSFTDDNIILDRNLQKYAGYTLCARYGNDAGQSDWSVPANSGGAYTRPAAPPRPTVYSSLGSENATTTTVVWRVATRDKAELPRLNNGYTVRTITYLDKRANDADSGTVPNPTPSAATCGIAEVPDYYTRSEHLADNLVTDDGEGIVIKPVAFNRPAAYIYNDQNQITTLAQNRTGGRKAYVCVQATSTETSAGPWILSGASTVKQQARPSS